MPTRPAELEVWGIGGRAIRAGQFQLGAAFPAELHTRWVLELAFGAFHGFPRQIDERG